MATLRSKTLSSLLNPMFQQGGAVKAPGEPAKKPGVQTYTSAFDKADQRSVLNVAKVSRKLAVGISPFLAEDLANASKMTRYANRAAQDATNRNEALIMANLAFLNPIGATAVERDDAFLNLLSWIPRADVVAVYVDYGITPAMQAAINVAITKNKKIEYRSVGEV